MDSSRLRASLAAFPGVLDALLAGIDDQSARVRPAAGGWAIVEIARHLLDEERRDFRPRLRLTLEGEEPWTPIDPEAWVDGERYIEASLAETLTGFRSERAASVAWLDGLEAPRWDASREHPALGRLHAGDLLASWAAHDALHLAQLARGLVEHVRSAAAPYGIRYATG